MAGGTLSGGLRKCLSIGDTEIQRAALTISSPTAKIQPFVSTLVPLGAERFLYAMVEGLFSDAISPEAFAKAYNRDPTSIESLPPRAQPTIRRAKKRFYEANRRDFCVYIPLGETHSLESTASLTEDDLKAFRLMFANAYLTRIEMVNRPESIKLVEKLVPISLRNIEIETQKKGFLQDRIVIHRYPKRHVVPNPNRSAMNRQCSAMRSGMGQAWGVIERVFPRETRSSLPKPKIPRPSGVESQTAVSRAKPTIRCLPSSMPAPELTEKERNPFRGEWKMLLTQKAIGAHLVGFVHGFDIADYLQDDGDSVQACADFLLAGTVSRIIFHVARYLHSIFILCTENLPDFLRATALWYVMCKRAESPQWTRVLAIALMAIKVSTSFVFENHSAEADRLNIQSSIFQAIDDWLNPYQMYDSIEKDEFHRAYQSQFTPDEGKRDIEIIVYLLEKNAFDPGDAAIARLLLKSETWDQAMAILAREPWGDRESGEASEGTYRPAKDHQVQRLLAWDIHRVQKTVPRDPPAYLRDRTLLPP